MFKCISLCVSVLHSCLAKRWKTDFILLPPTHWLVLAPWMQIRHAFWDEAQFRGEDCGGLPRGLWARRKGFVCALCTQGHIFFNSTPQKWGRLHVPLGRGLQRSVPAVTGVLTVASKKLPKPHCGPENSDRTECASPTMPVLLVRLHSHAAFPGC